MSLKDRFDIIARIGYKNVMERTFRDEWLLNELQLHNVMDMKQLKRQPGWKIIEQMLETQVAQCKDKALELSQEPEKNSTAMEMNYAIAFVCKKMLNLVNGTIGRERELVAERDELEARQSKQSTEFGG